MCQRFVCLRSRNSRSARRARRERLDAVDRGQRVLERPRDQPLDLFGRRRSVRGDDGDARGREGGQELERQPAQADPAQHQHAEGDHAHRHAALHGEATDRIPLYTHIPFEVTPDGFEPGPFHGWEDRDPWRRQDPAYVRLVERMEAEADLVNFGKQSVLEAEFDSLAVDEEIEKELRALKTPASKQNDKPSSD